MHTRKIAKILCTQENCINITHSRKIEEISGTQEKDILQSQVDAFLDETSYKFDKVLYNKLLGDLLVELILITILMLC